MESIEPSEQNVALEVNGVTVDVDVIAKDAHTELNNNGMVDKMDEKLVTSREIVAEPAETEPTKPAKTVANGGDETLAEPIESSTDMNNGEENSVTNNPSEGESKVDDAPEATNAKTESTDMPINEATESENKSKETRKPEDETVNVENNADSNESTDEISNESQANSAESTVTPKPTEPTTSNDDEQNSDASAASENASSEKSPKKKASSKKRKNRSRSQKKSTDYSHMMNYGVHVTQRQRRYFLQVARGVPVPDDDCEIFVSNIPINVLESELIPLFERFGKIFELRLMMSMRNPKRNAGFAFVRFTSHEAANEATEKLNDYEIVPGKLLAIRLSQPNLSLFVGNIHRGLTREQIHEKIGKQTPGLVKTFVKSSLYEATKNCGFCFLEYDCHSAALKAKRLLNRGNVWGRQLFVDWAQRRKQFDENALQESKTLFINYLPKATTDQQITEALSSFGTIEKVTKIKDYAFVLFTEHEAAMNAMNDADKMKLGNASTEISVAMPKTMKTRSRAPMPHRLPRHGRGRTTSYNRFKPMFSSSNKFYIRKQDHSKPSQEANAVQPINTVAGQTVAEQTVAEQTVAGHTDIGQTVIEQTGLPTMVITPPEPLTVN